MKPVGYVMAMWWEVMGIQGRGNSKTGKGKEKAISRLTYHVLPNVLLPLDSASRRN